MGFLEKINYPEDLKSIDINQLDKVALEIREFLLQSLSKTGGHLSSNLGVVELTIALHYCFDFSKDRLIWDVGHQVYTHKILTNRKHLFNTMRKKNGLSGFPKSNESIYDVFDTGHSSTSISSAIGLAAARDIKMENYSVVSVIGDGSMTGGLVYEALNNLAEKNTPMLIILNDNQMSISKNVGSMTNYLNNLRTTKVYRNVKNDIYNFFDELPIFGKDINKFLEKARDSIKYTIIPKGIFEHLGVKYFGPIDGHNISDLINVINNIKNINKPVVLHVVTKKGKGYEFAEKDPIKYHGVSSFNVKTGEFFNKFQDETFSDVFGKFMVKEAAKNKKIVAITPAMPCGSGLEFFSKTYPKRFFDVGIAEEHAVIFSAGLAKGGIIPVLSVYSTFLQRAYDQIIHDVCIQNLHVVFAVDRAGVVGEDGKTHQGIYDLSYLSSIPNLVILAPKNKLEFVKMLSFAINKYDKPIAIRYPKGKAENSELEECIEFGKCEFINKGEEIAIISAGTMSLKAINIYKKLIQKGYKPTVVNIRFIRPIDINLIDYIKTNHKYIFTIEDNILSGGFGSIISQELIKNEIFDKHIYNFSFPDDYIEQASTTELYQKYGLDEISIYERILSIVENR